MDLTRLVSRRGTGIDRVERAYLDHFLSMDAPLFGLVRTRYGWLLLDRAGCAALGNLADARRLAIARALPWRLHRILPKGIYWNIGHALRADALAQIARAGLKIAVMIHDTIPLDHPDLSRADQIAPFAAKIAATSRYADWVIHISDDARQRTEAHFAAHGRVPPGVTAHLGVTLTPPAAFVTDRPYVVILGTIEPRKNHALLFDIWERLGPDAPQLRIIGARGWASADLFARMDALIARGLVVHHDGADDATAMGILAGARALLFPSLAEGFGLPPWEALALGIPVIANDLPVLREVLGSFAVYLDAADSYSWMETIGRLTGAAPNKKQRMPPTWSQHFKTVLTVIS